MMASTPVKFAWPPIGQDRAAAFLEKSLASGNIAQTYIFAGPKDLGKASLALAFAHNLWRLDGVAAGDDNFESLNSDLYILEKEAEKKQIGVEQARDFIKRLALSSFLNSYKIGIIKEAETLSAEAQNALLKTLEEPREKVIIILLVEELSALMPTIASRSQILYFYPVAASSVYDYLLASLDIKRSLAKDLAAAALGRPLQARQWAEDKDSYQEHLDRVRLLFDFLQMPLAERLAVIASAGTENNFSRELAEEYLAGWESLWRDYLLLSLGQNNHLRYPFLLPDWQKFTLASTETERIRHALACLSQLRQARTFLQGFVNPKNVLESLAIYF